MYRYRKMVYEHYLDILHTHLYIIIDSHVTSLKRLTVHKEILTEPSSVRFSPSTGRRPVKWLNK